MPSRHPRPTRAGPATWRRLVSFAAAALAMVFAANARAETAPWATDPGVGPNQVVFTLDISCPAVSFVCAQIDGYSEQATSTATGAASFDLDDVTAEIQFETDSSQDVGSGPQPAYLTVSGSDVAFPNVAFAGVPEITDVLVFALTSPPIAVAGLALPTPGDHPFSETLSYSGTGTVFGDLEFILGPDIIVPPDDVVVTGIFRVLGDPDLDGFLEYELRDVTGSFSVQNPTTIGGEPVTVSVTADMTLNLSGEIPLAGGVVLPALSPVGTAILIATLTLAARVAARRKKATLERGVAT